MMMCILVKIQGPRVSRLLGTAHRPSVALPLLNSPASLLTAVPTLPYAPVIPTCLTYPQFTLHGHHSLFYTPLLHPSIWNALLFFLAPWGQTHLLSQLRNHLSAEMRTLSLWGTIVHLMSICKTSALICFNVCFPMVDLEHLCILSTQRIMLMANKGLLKKNESTLQLIQGHVGL